MVKKKKSDHTAAKVGFGVATIAAIAAGAYFLYGKDAKKNRAKVKGWMLKAKGEILESLEKLKEVSEPKYHEIVDKVIAKYSKLKHVDSADLAKLTKEIKSHWKTIQKDLHLKRKSPKSKKQKYW